VKNSSNKQDLFRPYFFPDKITKIRKKERQKKKELEGPA